MNVFNWGRKENSKASTTDEPTSSFSPLQNIINRRNQYRHTLVETSTAPSKLNANDVVVSSSSSFETNQTGPSSSSLADTSALEHGASNEKEKSRISKTVTIGQEDAYDKVCDFLTRREVGMVGIYGMGGVGKTTLLRRVRNEFLKRSNFNVIWIVVSATVNKTNIHRSIMGVLNLSFYEDEDPETRGIKINKAPYDDKRSQIALLLDDIWEFIDLEEVGVAGGLGLDSSMFKIVFTTRSQDVCFQMHPDQMIRINCLGPEDSWALFNRVVGEKTLCSDRIVELAREVADECGGLPLALTIVGKAMVSKTCVGSWEDALNNLRSRPLLVSKTERDLYERLKFSYDNLENQVERDCFLFCCMYPEDHNIYIDQLIDRWIGEGLFDVYSYDTYQEICNRGLSIVDILVAKCMIESYEDSVTVHDVIRDMGLWIGSKINLFVHIDRSKTQGEKMTEVGNKGRWAFINGLIPGSYCAYLSVLHMKGSYLHKLSLPFMPKLKVLVLYDVPWQLKWQKNRASISSILGLLIELRHLELSHSFLEGLSSNIGKLTKLWVIILISNSGIRTLPTTIGDVCDLKKLRIWNSPLTAIPPQFEKLKNLEIVQISKVYGVVWLGMFNQLTKLRKLDLRVKILRWDVLRLNKLEELVVYVEKNKGPLTKDLIQLPSLQFLEMNGWPITDSDLMRTTLKTMHKLHVLSIGNTLLDKFLIPVTSHDLCSQLKTLSFNSCYLQEIRFGERALHKLDYLKVSGCPFLETISGLQHLQQLRELEICFIGYECLEETLATSDVEQYLLPELAGDCMPNLQCFSISHMKKMKRIYNDDVVFPHLSHFNLRDCPMLKKLPRGLMKANRILEGEIKGTKEWWEGLEWEDDDFKSFLLPLLKITYD